MTDLALAQLLVQRLEATSPQATLQALAACRRACRDFGVPLFLVGGAVRDLVLEREGYDIDLSIEGDAGLVAERVARETGARAVSHPRFGTARVSGRGFRIDLARTRRETYPHPGALPVVEPATLSEDLARRDFTINAVALRLEPEPVEVIDPFRGIADARSSLVRVLHDLSFQDDATRMLRAVRYATRLDFKIATQTAALIRRDLSYLGTISGPRLRRELALIFEEPAAASATQEAQQLGVLGALHPSLSLAPDVAARWHQALAGPKLAPLDELGFCVVANPGDEGTAASVSRWLHLTGRVERALADLVRLKSQSPKLALMKQTPSVATEALDGHAPAAVWAHAVLLGGDEAEVCVDYLNLFRHVRPLLTGDDLLALGVPAGPGMGDVLRRLRAAKLDGHIATREQELTFVRELS
jgi:tRNA nucleotidyltransferase (CCA-adding enzyme)